MKNILCFGDSNTWGMNPETRERFDLSERWTGVAQQRLDQQDEIYKSTGDFTKRQYRIIEEGLNGRTTVHNDPIEPGRCGLDYFIPCLLTHKPLDLVIIMLGTNDIKKRYALSPYDIAAGAGRLADIALKSDYGPSGSAPAVLLVSPIIVGDLTNSWLGEMFDYDTGSAKSLGLSSRFSEKAKELGCFFLDAAAIAGPSPLDGVHFDRNGQQALGGAIAAEIKKILG